ncbi:TolB-like translocation protein [Paractinoplanes durhamensis]|uniref:Uncharacterized protein n=1 Tax=Paractinoplanes durhamensis TaxID=113563 RepID=A0ABQ3YYX2_9ACTN|nr:hypothetical protein [Actinoplanes durhamensis]GIE02790.1 hypothetical protein Adu01nite_41400 [Actinoplanes durhamensis]
MRTRTRWALSGAAVVAGAAWLVVPALSASASETTTSLPVTEFGSVLADSANHHVYVTGGPRTSNLAVLDEYGVLQQQVALGGASGMALSPDHETLYVALAKSGAGGIAAIDTATLAVEQTFSSVVCPSYLAAGSEKVYFTYGCDGGGLGSLDPATGAMTLGLGAATPDARPVSAAGGKLVTTTSTGIDLYDITGATPTLLTSAAPCTGASTATFNGGRILATCLSPGAAFALSAVDLSVTGTFGSNDQPAVGVAGSADGSTVAVATTTNYAPTVWVSAADGTALRNHPLPAGETIDYQGVALNGDGSTAYAVSHLSHAYRLHVFTSEAKTPTLTLTGPATADPGRPVTLTGTFGGGAGKQLAVTRTDLTGAHQLAVVTTGDGGAFTVTDQPAGGGDNIYAVSFAGDGTWGPAQATATVAVARKASGVWVETDRSHYAYGATAKVTIWVGHTTGQVCLASNLGLSTCTPTDKAGVAHLTYQMLQNTVLTASFAGNATYAPASMKLRVTTSAQVQEAIKGTRLAVFVQPYRPGATVRFTEQTLVHGKWRTVTTWTAKLDGNSRAVGVATGKIVRNQPYRIRASFIADAKNAAADGVWKTFKIR